MKNASTAAGGRALPQPYIAAATRMPEFTLRAVIVGTLLGMIFGASSLYLVLKVGLTVSASIPVAVISITLFRLASKFGVTRRHHPREQHRADRGLGRRVDRLRRRRHDAGDHDPRLRPRADARDAGRRARRPARHPDDDPAAPRADRAAARHAQVSRGHGLRRGAQGGRLRRIARAGLGRAQDEARAAAAGLAAAPARAPSSPASASALLYKTLDGRPSRAGRTCPSSVFGAPFKARVDRRRRSRPSCSAWATSSARASRR